MIKKENLKKIEIEFYKNLLEILSKHKNAIRDHYIIWKDYGVICLQEIKLSTKHF